jgi:hypothetical protein
VGINPSTTPMAAFPCRSTASRDTVCGRPSPAFQPAGRWFTAKRPESRVCTTSNRIGPIYGRRVDAGWHRSGPMPRKPSGWGGRLEPDNRALPLTRGQPDIWLAQETGHSGTKWQPGLFARIEDTVKPDLLKQAISKALQEVERRAAFSEADGEAFQMAIDYPDLELAFYDPSGSRDPVQEARGRASSIPRTPVPFSRPLFKFGLFRTRPDEYHWFSRCHHIDGLGIALVGRRIATIYSALISGRPIPPAFFGSLQDLVNPNKQIELKRAYGTTG